MPLTAYRQVLAVRGVRSLTLLGIVARLPNAATGVVLTVHVVQTLGRSYAQAGLVVAALTIGTAIGAPWRGRMVDRLGLRRALLPSLLAEGLVWGSAPWLSYWWLVGAVVVGGAFFLPVFTVIRLALSAMVPVALRRTAFALDSVSVEVSFMVAPAVGILVATHVSTTAALLAIGVTAVLAGCGLIALNPPTRTAHGRARAAGHPSIPVSDGPKPRMRVTGPLVLVLVATSAATIVLAGTDVSIIASLRSTDQLEWTGLVASVWAFASLLGGLVYGAIPRSIPPTWLLLGLGVLTIPVALVSGPLALGLAMLPAGFLCAPVITATAEVIAELVPEEVRGEAMGWHGSALTAGIAIGAPLAGLAIDHVAPWAGFVTVGAVGTLIAATGLLALGAGRRQLALVLTAASRHNRRMRIELVQGDITTQDVEAIVNAANSRLLGGGGVDGAIHAAAGPDLLEECRRLRATSLPDGLPTGQAVATGAGRLAARWVIHTVGPVYPREADPASLLASAYRESLRVAEEVGAGSVAFPSISTGVYAYPLDEAAPIALSTVRDAAEIAPGVELVRFVLFGDDALDAFRRAESALS